MRLLSGTLVALASIFIAVSFFGCSASQQLPDKVHAPSNDGQLSNGTDGNVISLSDDAEKLAGIKIGETQEKLLNFAVKTTGDVSADANLLTHVTTPVNGRVSEVLVSVGDKVEEGKPLIMIRSTDIEQSEGDLLQNEAQVNADLKRDLLQSSSDIATAEAQLTLSESTFKRMDNLLVEKVASRADVEAAHTQYEKDRINLESLRRKREATVSLSEERMKLLLDPIKQKLNLLGVSNKEIAEVLKTGKIDPMVPVLAPEPGIVIERLVNQGELVDPSKPLFTIGNFSNVWIKADVYEKDLSKVKVGQPIELELDSFPGEKFLGRLDYVADSINPDTRTLSVRAQVDNPGWKLKPQMFARMRILVGEMKVLTVPKSAVQDAGDNKVVYEPLAGGKFREIKVKLGSESGDYVEVLGGLRRGEKIVTEGSFDLRSESLRESS